MKRFWISLLVLCCTLGAQAQLLWKISGNDLKQPSYIFGTHHVAPLSVKDSIADMKEALSATQQVYGEIVIADLMKPEKALMMREKMAMPQGKTIKDLYSKEQFDSIHTVLQQIFGMDPTPLYSLKPTALTAQVVVILAAQAVKNFNPMQGLDDWFQKEATRNHKKVGGMETAEEQFDLLFNSQSLERQAKLLYCLVTNLDYQKDLAERLTQAYLAQDLKKMLEITEEKNNDACDSTPEEQDALLKQRNTKWVQKMPQIMKEAPTLFVVGAGHLPGDYGVLHLLKAAGYQVTPMK